MTSIFIPTPAYPGFKIIANLTDDQLVKLAEYLDSLDSDPRISKLHEFLRSIKVPSIDDFLTTLMSFSELLKPKGVDLENLSNNLADSFVAHNPNFGHQKQKKLQKHLLEIFNHSDKLSLAIKASELINEEDKRFMDSRVVTDIRLIFNDVVDEGIEELRSAMVVHHLNIGFKKSDGEYDKVIIAIDYDDLKSLKKDIDRAINKEEVIQKNYKSSFNILNFNNHD